MEAQLEVSCDANFRHMRFKSFILKEVSMWIPNQYFFFLCVSRNRQCVVCVVVVGSLQKVLEKVTHEAVRLKPKCIKRPQNSEI